MLVVIIEAFSMLLTFAPSQGGVFCFDPIVGPVNTYMVHSEIAIRC